VAEAGFRESGWVWEGLGFDPGLEPSSYGVGEGARYFGLDRSQLYFHPNDEITLAKLSDKREVVCDISKWKWVEIESTPAAGTGFRNWLDNNPATVIAEAARLSELSLQFPQVTGGIIDDASAMLQHETYHDDHMAAIKAALRSANPDLKLWAVIYSHELTMPRWQALLPHVDVISLWVWEARHLPGLDEYVSQCAAVFPGKPIVVGSYLRDYPTRSPVPLDLLAHQYETMSALYAAGQIVGFSILGGCLIDQQPRQAEWIRRYLHSDD
jgi:hypothetical protein